MRAAVLYEPNKPLVIEDVSINKPTSREVLIRTTVAGLCHSDLHFIRRSLSLAFAGHSRSRVFGRRRTGRSRRHLREAG